MWTKSRSQLNGLPCAVRYARVMAMFPQEQRECIRAIAVVIDDEHAQLEFSHDPVLSRARANSSAAYPILSPPSAAPPGFYVFDRKRLTETCFDGRPPHSCFRSAKPEGENKGHTEGKCTHVRCV